MQMPANTPTTIPSTLSTRWKTNGARFALNGKIRARPNSLNNNADIRKAIPM